MSRNLKIIAVTFFFVIVNLILGNIIIIGDKLGQITHIYIEYSFYILMILLFCMYVVLPVYRVHKAPEFPTLSVEGKGSTKQLYTFAKCLSANYSYIKDEKIRKEQQEDFSKSIKNADTAKLKFVISKEIERRINGDKELGVLGINERIKEWAKSVFMVTAVSQNSKFDTIAVMLMNYKMISDIVLASGFRPTKPHMFKIYVKVLTTALITYCTSEVFTDVGGVAPFDISDDDVSIEDNDVDAGGEFNVDDESFSETVQSNLGNLKIPGILIGSAVQGSLNALMTLRIGYVVKAYLIEGSGALSGTRNKRKTKRMAIKSAYSALPSVVMSATGSLTKGTYNMLKKAFTSQEE